MNHALRVALQRKQKALDAAHKVNAVARNDGNRELTASEKREFEDHMADYRSAERDIVEERAAIEDERSAPALRVPGRAPALGTGVGGRRYAELFPDAAHDDGGFASLGDFLRALHGGLADQRMVPAASSGASEGVGADGGFMVPSQYVADMLDASLEEEIVRSRAVVRPMDTNSMYVSGFNTLNHTSSIGGFAASWMTEGSSMTVQKGLIRTITMKAKKLGILTAATNELVADSPYFERELIPMLTKAIGWYLDLAFLTGDGAGEPLGVLNDPALVTVNKEGSQAASTITWNNLKEMFGRLHPASHKNAVWVANTATKVQLLGLVQYAKNVAGTENVGGTWIPVLRDDGKGGFTILGIPVLFTEKTPTLGTVGDILLTDFTQYIIGMRREMTLDKSGHLGFQTDETHFRGIVRADGFGRWNAPMTPKTGSTLSWCVALQTRA